MLQKLLGTNIPNLEAPVQSINSQKYIYRHVVIVKIAHTKKVKQKSKEHMKKKKGI